jgi:hypothetical protein
MNLNVTKKPFHFLVAGSLAMPRLVPPLHPQPLSRQICINHVS